MKGSRFAAIFILCALLSTGIACSDNSESPTPTSTTTPVRCPTNTPEPIPSVEPVTSPTNQLMQTIRVHNIGRTSVTITCESGTFTATGFDANTGASLINVTLLPDTIHHLQIEAHVSSWDIGGCHYPGYNFSIPPWDQSGNTFIIVQQTNLITPTP